MANVLPLYQFFEILRRQYGFPLGLRNYLDLVEIIYKRPYQTREDIILLCQAMWSTSQQEYRTIKEISTLFFPDKFTMRALTELEWRYGDADHASPLSLDIESEDSEEVSPTEEASAGQNSEVIDLSTEEPESSNNQSINDIIDTNSNIEDSIDLFFSHTYSNVGVEVMGETRFKYSVLTFAGTLPVPSRQIDQAWRRYRISRRIGPRTRLDIDATIDAISRSGSLIEPVLVPQHMNISRLVLLVDTGGSMIPFKRAINALIASARQNNMAQVDTYYFHDVPHKFVYKTTALTDDGAILIDDLIRSAVNTGLLIISDGGAARGNIDEPRAEHTTQFIKALRRHIRFIAWLNPMPEERWIKSTAGMIAEQSAVPMYYYDRVGLEAAIALVRGASHFKT